MMKTFIYCIIFLFTSSAVVNAAISKAEFDELSQIFLDEFKDELSLRKERLLINNPPNKEMANFWWELNEVHASYSSYKEDNGLKTHLIFLFGGYARLSYMTIEGVAMTLCHELGHGIGGTPYKDSTMTGLVSVEGQADYFAARFCIKRILKKLNFKKIDFDESSYVWKNCHATFTDQNDIKLCFRAFQILEVEKKFLENSDKEFGEISIETPETSMVDKVNTDSYFYPNIQCRLDSMVNGILNKERPRCWWGSF